MDAPLDLYGASREELVDLILAQRDLVADQARQLGRQQEEIATLRATIAQLTARLGAVLAAAEPPPDDPAGVGTRPPPMPGLKAGGPCPRRPRKRRPHGFGRRRMRPTTRLVHAYARCPACREPLTGGTLKRTREVIEVPLVPAVVTEHAYLERRCRRCRRRWLPGPGLGGEVVGQGRLGVGLLSLIATLREEARLPVATIRWYLRPRHGLQLSAGAIVGACATVAAKAAPVVAGIRTDSRGRPAVNADETGGREDGTNGYVWTFSTPTQRSFVRGSREKAVLEAVLGEDFAGVLVSDFAAAYTNYEGRHQYCWAHLLRDADDLTEQHRCHAGVRGWAAALHDLYARARSFADPDPAARRRAQRACEAELRTLGAPYLADEAAPQRGLCQRIERHLAELFVFVADPAVPPTNNAAERSLRHLVTCRKVSGGTRSPAGSATKLALATLFGTWRAQGLDPLAHCRQLLTSPQV